MASSLVVMTFVLVSYHIQCTQVQKRFKIQLFHQTLNWIRSFLFAQSIWGTLHVCVISQANKFYFEVDDRLFYVTRRLFLYSIKNYFRNVALRLRLERLWRLFFSFLEWIYYNFVQNSSMAWNIGMFFVSNYSKLEQFDTIY